jgi:vacuolar-type H+-ATPase subunit E/Vma4
LIDDWDDEAEEEATAAEEEELARVQQEIERIQQEQESILRRQVAMQRAEARRQNIKNDRGRLAEMQYNLDILHHQGHEAPLQNQIPN